ncbi:MAG: hypothetical protein ACLQMS_11600 [Desulfomonilaceae bacterium]
MVSVFFSPERYVKDIQDLKRGECIFSVHQKKNVIIIATMVINQAPMIGAAMMNCYTKKKISRLLLVR